MIEQSIDEKVELIRKEMKLIKSKRKFKWDEKKKFHKRILNIIFFNIDTEEDSKTLFLKMKEENTKNMRGLTDSDMYLFKRIPFHGNW